MQEESNSFSGLLKIETPSSLLDGQSFLIQQFREAIADLLCTDKLQQPA
jgi:hypothetical protein